MQNNKNKYVILGSLCALVLILATTYSLFQSVLNVKGTTNINSSWDVKITDVTKGTVTGDAEEASKPTWGNLSASIAANLFQKGDSIEYEVTVTNNGTLDAKLEDIKETLISKNEALKISFDGFIKGEKLYKNTSQVIKVKLEYNPDFNGVPEIGKTEIDFSLDYAQAEGGTIEPTNDYLLTFDYKTNGGKEGTATKYYSTENKEIDLTETANKDGYTFLGWNTNKDAMVGLESFTMPSENTTLYAIFRKELQVNYNKTYGVTSIQKTNESCYIYNKQEGCEITLSNIMAENHYTVTGWYVDDNLIGMPNDKYILTQDQTLTAKVNPVLKEPIIKAEGLKVTIKYPSGCDERIKCSYTVNGVLHEANNSLVEIDLLEDSIISARTYDNNGDEEKTKEFTVDLTGPEVTLSSNPTSNAITVSVNATDSLSDITKYEYSIDGGKTYKKSKSNVYTFSNLNRNTEYNMIVKVTNSAGVSTTENITATTTNLELVTFSEKMTDTGKDLTITYPDGCGSNYTCTYIKDGETVAVNEKSVTVPFTKSGNIIAVVNDGANEVSNSYYVEILSTIKNLDAIDSEYKSKVTSIEIVDTKTVPENAIKSWDVSANKDNSAVAYIINDPNNEGFYNLYIGSYGGVEAGENLNSTFLNGYTELQTVDLSLLDTTQTTNMLDMFSDCNKLTTLDVSGFDTSNVKNMSGMFYNCTNLTTLDVSGFDTSNVTNMSWMFSGCNKLTTLDVSNFNTSNVTKMLDMFSNCKNLTTLDVSNFDTSNVTDMSLMFYNCTNLITLDLSNFDTSNVTNMSWMFYNCTNLTTLDVSNFNTSNVTNMLDMFSNCKNLTTLDVSNFDTSNVTDMSGMFSGCNKLTTLDVSNFDTSNVTNMSYMFSACTNLTTLDVSNFDTSNVTNMLRMFSASTNLITLDISNFNTSNVTNMQQMFDFCSSLTTIYVGPKWTTANANATSMFSGCGTDHVTLKE